MDDNNPVTKWIELARAGSDEAVGELWRHYFAKLTRLARNRMALLSRGVYDEEDAALSAMHSFFRGARDGRFPQLNDRDNLWRLLVVITSRKVSGRRQIEGAQKRGGSANEDSTPIVTYSQPDMLEVIGREPTPDFVAEMFDDLQARLQLLPDQTLRRIALLTMDGLTQTEIATALNCTVRTIRRKQDAIRAVWEDSDPGLGETPDVRSEAEIHIKSP